MSGEGGDEHFHRAVYEALESIVAPALRDAIISEALRAARRSSVPSDPEEFADFVDAPLRIALTRAVGHELGESISDELAHLASIASSRPPRAISTGAAASLPRGVTPPQQAARRTTTEPTVYARQLGEPPARRGTTDPAADSNGSRSAAPPAPADETGARLGRVRTKPSPDAKATLRSAEEYAESLASRSRPLSRVSARPPASDSYPKGVAEAIGVRGTESERAMRRLPFVLVATLEPQLVRQLAAWLDPRAAVIRVRGPTSLIHDLENSADAPTVIIVDCRQPSVRPAALAALADDFPDTVRVVMWGATPETERQVVMISDRARGWFVCSAHAEPRDLAERCAQLVR